MAMRWGKWWVE
jgi:hypothetical protein